MKVILRIEGEDPDFVESALFLGKEAIIEYIKDPSYHVFTSHDNKICFLRKSKAGTLIAYVREKTTTP